VNIENPQQGRAVSKRCRVCHLPREALDEIHRQRLAWGATYDELAERTLASGRRCSTSSLRRHFRHAGNYELPGGAIEGANVEEIATPFDSLLSGWINEKTVTETLVRSLLQRMQALDRQQRTLRDAASRERLAGRYLQTVSALERALKRLEEFRRPEREAGAKLSDVLGRAGAATIEVYKARVQEQISVVKQAFYDYLDKRFPPEEMLRQISRWEREWSTGIASRITETLIPILREAGVQPQGSMSGTTRQGVL
jgi:hypothetical protein